MSSKTKIIIIFFISFGFCINPVLAKNVKIGLVSGDSVVVGSSNGAQIFEETNNVIITDLTKNESITLKQQNGKIQFAYRGILFGPFQQSLNIIPVQGSFVRCDGKYYRGNLKIILSPSMTQITVINNVDLEDYLFSVVPSEMPAKWHLEALKAQAVAARSYSIGFLGRRIDKGYDLESTVEDQVYSGVVSERASTTKAVVETKNQILTGKDGKPLIAYFHSSAGGHTDSIENIWSHKKDVKPSSAIQPIKDFDDNSPYFSWTRKFAYSHLNKSLENLALGNVLSIKPLNKTVSGRIQKIELNGASEKKVIHGEEFRRLVGLPSSMFDMKLENGVYTFKGKGFGHGLGLSQWGAKALAEKGYSYKKILNHYYPGAKLVDLSSINK